MRTVLPDFSMALKPNSAQKPSFLLVFYFNPIRSICQIAAVKRKPPKRLTISHFLRKMDVLEKITVTMLYKRHSIAYFHENTLELDQMFKP